MDWVWLLGGTWFPREGKEVYVSRGLWVCLPPSKREELSLYLGLFWCWLRL